MNIFRIGESELFDDDNNKLIKENCLQITNVSPFEFKLIKLDETNLNVSIKLIYKALFPDECLNIIDSLNFTIKVGVKNFSHLNDLFKNDPLNYVSFDVI